MIWADPGCSLLPLTTGNWSITNREDERWEVGSVNENSALSQAPRRHRPQRRFQPRLYRTARIFRPRRLRQRALEPADEAGRRVVARPLQVPELHEGDLLR